MKVIDRYIIGKFLGTLSFMLILLSIIVVVVDVQQKSPRIEGNGFKVSYFLIIRIGRYISLLPLCPF